MATKFLEPGGDADFLVGTTNGFWGTNGGLAAVATDFVHGGHVKSIKYRSGVTDSVHTQASIVGDAGSRISFWVYITALPTTAALEIAGLRTASLSVVDIKITSGGVLQLFNTTTTQIGTNGATLSTGQWYRISLAYTITSTLVNRFELFVNGVSSISITNATLTNTGSSIFFIGNWFGSSDATFSMRSSDHYIDNSSALTDPGNIWVTAKRPIANGTSNQFTTQVGAGGSGYGTGHSPQVNERALSTTNAWSIQSASKQTEEYTIEAKSVGDIDISTATIIDYMGWVSAKVGVNSTGNIIVNNVATNIAVTTSNKVFTKIAGSSTYPAGNTDIGMDTNTVNQLFTLNECGIIVAYIPGAIVANKSNFLAFM